MSSSAKRRKQQRTAVGPVQQGAAAIGAIVSPNPAMVAGATTFLVSLAFVSANALWYQPHAHTGPFFATRAFESFVDPQYVRDREEPQTLIKLERQAEPEARRPLKDPAVERVQSILKDLGFYDGTVDGLNGPNTAKAVSVYQEKMGVKATGEIDGDLIEMLGAQETTGAITPQPAPRPVQAGKDLVASVQTGLRAFGNKDIEVDGVLGSRTRAAIKEFQILFGLPVTGQADAQTYAKMQAERLVK